MHISDMQTYLGTDEAAAYLRIRERKLYELAATGGIPCSKATGKWLFPRVALDRWVEAGLAAAYGAMSSAPPPIIGGSHDPFLEWAARHARSGLALLNEGSQAGLRRLERNEVAMAAIHLHGPGDDDDGANVAAMAANADLRDGVLIAFAKREQGLAFAPGRPAQPTTLAEVARSRARIGLRQGGAGASLLLDRLLATAGLGLADLAVAGGAYETGQDLAFAIRAGDADCGLMTRAVASANGLVFAPLAWERFDLAMRRRTYFEPGPQRLFALMRSDEFRRHAQLLGGFDVAEAGAVRFNG
jgi:excisionase family DNA binding protein